jgi:hypothetical protein
MNEQRIVKMAQKRTAKLSVLFVLVSMIFLVPVLAEKAQARIDAFARTHWGLFSNVRGHMDDGSFLMEPRIRDNGKEIVWATKGDRLPSGDEKGFVSANVDRGEHRVIFYFNNPRSGPNTCDTSATHGLIATCRISRGNFATAHFEVRRHLPLNLNEVYESLPLPLPLLQMSTMLLEAYHRN